MTMRSHKRAKQRRSEYIELSKETLRKLAVIGGPHSVAQNAFKLFDEYSRARPDLEIVCYIDNPTKAFLIGPLEQMPDEIQRERGAKQDAGSI
jgi:hypothetical protein